jgi:hypothetical protein
VVFYELVTGRKPYTADTPMAVIFKHMTDPLPRPRQFVPDLPERVEQVLFKALAKKPEDRYQSMAEFAAALDGLVGIGPKVETALPQPSKKEDSGEYQTGTETVDVAVLSGNAGRSQKTKVVPSGQETFHGSPNILDVGVVVSPKEEFVSPAKSTSAIKTRGIDQIKDQLLGLMVHTFGENGKIQINFYNEKKFWTNFGIMGIGFLIYLLIRLLFSLGVLTLADNSMAVLWILIGAFVGLGLRKQIGIHWVWVLSIGIGFGFPISFFLLTVFNLPTTFFRILEGCFIFLPGLLISLTCLVNVEITWRRLLSLFCLWSAFQLTCWVLWIAFPLAVLAGLLCNFATLLWLKDLQPKKVSTIRTKVN